MSLPDEIDRLLQQQVTADLDQLGRAQTGELRTEIKPDGYLVVIRRVADGVERTYEMKDCTPPEGPDDFWWTDGNGACDCNRVDFFPSGPVVTPTLTKSAVRSAT